MLPRTGDLLARKYRLGGELGRGAMGIVYEARHETLDQRVAIKILRRSEIDDEESAVRRFEREARIVAKLDSPHVVKVIDVDRTDDGVPYLVMELLEGRDLSAEVDARPEARIPTAEAVRWMVQVCEAMRVAHGAGVVHRDLKLSNVFLTAGGTVKVLDFGVAVLRSSDAERSTTMSVAGTPRYMAPEQLLGEPPDPSSDIWAIGVMLYRTLSGRFPYDAPTMAAQMLAMMEGCPPLATIAPHVPKTLAEIVTRALGHTLEQRWASAKELSLALAPFGTGEVVETKPAVAARPREEPEPAAEPRKPSSRLPLLVIGAALVALGAYALRATDPPEPRTRRVAIDAAMPVEPAPPPSRATSAIVSAAPPDTPSAPPAAASTRARPRAAASAAPSAPRPAPTHGGADDGFPPHL